MKAELREEFINKLHTALDDCFNNVVNPADIVIGTVDKMTVRKGDTDVEISDLVHVQIRNDAFTAPDAVNLDTIVVKAIAGSVCYEWYMGWSEIEDDISDASIEQLAWLIMVGCINHLLNGVLTPKARRLYILWVTDAVNEKYDALKEPANE